MLIWLLLFTLVHSSSLFCMQAPARLRMTEADETEFNKLVPPPVLHMTDDELTKADGSWLQNEEELAQHNSEFHESSLIKKICNSPEDNKELVLMLIKKTDARCKKQVAGCCLNAVKPSKFVVLTAAFAYGAYREAQQGNACNTHLPFCCLFAYGTLGKCFTTYKAMQVYSKKIHKNCTARNVLFDLLMQISDKNTTKKTK